MYLGTVSVRQPRYVEQYRPPFGTFSYCVGHVDTPHRHYRCEHCGKEFQLLGTPAERFYCGGPGSCGRLVGIDPAPRPTLPERIAARVAAYPGWTPAERRRLPELLDEILAHCSEGTGSGAVARWCEINLADLFPTPTR